MMASYSLQLINAAILSASVVGVGLSFYAFTVETTLERESTYKPYCDISKHFSCSKVFMSEYGKGFGLIPKDWALHVQNSIFGMIFYTIVAALSLFNHYWNTVLLLVAAVFSNLFSVYLSRILYLLREVCVVCISMYVVNAVVLIFAMRKIREINRLAAKKKKTK